MNTLLLHVFQCFERERINYCLMRDAQHLDARPDVHPDATMSEIDILVQESHLTRCSDLLCQLGFLPLPSFGYVPHHFFVAYEPRSDHWFKLDIVSQVAYGAPIPVLHTELAEACLQQRRRVGDLFVPSPECELITLLMHCVLDKGRFTDAHIQRLKTLRHQVTDEALITSLLRTNWHPAMSWSPLAEQIDAEAWGVLVAAGKAIETQQTAQQRLSAALRTRYAQAQRKINRWITARSPRTLKVAILAPDGAGKSTLVDGIRKAYAFSVRTLYMGLYQKKSGSRSLFALPGVGFAFRLAWLWGRCLLAYYHQARRRLVLFDRYTYDSLLAPPRRQSRMSRWRRWITAHACPAPELVIVLDAPGEVLYARKGEHSPERLERQRQQYLALRQTLPQMVVVDATQELDQVRRDVIARIWDAQVKQHMRSMENSVEEAIAT